MKVFGSHTYVRVNVLVLKTTSVLLEPEWKFSHTWAPKWIDSNEAVPNLTPVPYIDP